MKTLALVLSTGILCVLSGCSKNTQQTTADAAQSVVQTAPPSSQLALVPSAPNAAPTQTDAATASVSTPSPTQDDDGKTPLPPVAQWEVLGYWDDNNGTRAYAHVESDVASLQRAATKGEFTLTLADGRAMRASCIGNVAPGKVDAGNCSVFTFGKWYRINLGDLKNDWGLELSDGETGKFASYKVDAVCSAHGKCETSEEAGRRALAKLKREQDEEAKKRPGYDAKSQLDSLQP